MFGDKASQILHGEMGTKFLEKNSQCHNRKKKKTLDERYKIYCLSNALVQNVLSLVHHTY